MTIHLFFLFLLFFLGVTLYPVKNKQKIYTIIPMILMFVIGSFRDVSVGNDTMEYVRVFNNFGGISDLIRNLNISRYEIGYVTLNTIIKTFTSNYTVLLGIVTGFYLYSVSRFILKYSYSRWLSVYLFYNLGMFFLVFNLLRQCIAIGIFLFAVDYIIEKKFLRYIILVIGASLFHVSAILLLPLYFIKEQRINWKFMLSFFAILTIGLIMFDQIALFFIRIFPQYSRYYLSSVYSEGGVRLASVLNSLVIMVIVTLGKYIKSAKFKDNPKELNKQENTSSKFELILIFALGISILSIRFNLLDRLVDYFLVVSIVYLPNSIKRLRSSYFLTTFIIVVLFAAYSTMILYYRPEWSGIFPYRFR